MENFLINDKRETKGQRFESLIDDWCIFTAWKYMTQCQYIDSSVILYNRFATDKPTNRECPRGSSQISLFYAHYLVHEHFIRLSPGCFVKHILIGNELFPWRTFTRIVQRFLPFDCKLRRFCVCKTQFLVNKRILLREGRFYELKGFLNRI